MVKDLPVNAGNIRHMGSIPGSRRFLEKEMASYSVFLPEITWTKKTDRQQSVGSQSQTRFSD